MMALALGLNHLGVWFQPVYWVMIFIKLVQQSFSGYYRPSVSSIDFTVINQLFNRLSTVVMLFLGSTLLIWLPLIAAGEGVEIAENIASKVLLENYKPYDVVYPLTGNLWSLLDRPKNGNLISIIIFGLCSIYLVFQLRTITQKRLLKYFLWLFLTLSTFGVLHSRAHTLHTLITVLLGLLYTDFQPFLTMISLLYPLAYLPSDPQLDHSHFLPIIYQVGY